MTTLTLPSFLHWSSVLAHRKAEDTLVVLHKYERPIATETLGEKDPATSELSASLEANWRGDW